MYNGEVYTVTDPAICYKFMIYMCLEIFKCTTIYAFAGCSNDQVRVTRDISPSLGRKLRYAISRDSSEPYIVVLPDGFVRGKVQFPVALRGQTLDPGWHCPSP